MNGQSNKRISPWVASDQGDSISSSPTCIWKSVWSQMNKRIKVPPNLAWTTNEWPNPLFSRQSSLDGSVYQSVSSSGSHSMQKASIFDQLGALDMCHVYGWPCYCMNQIMERKLRLTFMKWIGLMKTIFWKRKEKKKKSKTLHGGSCRD